ncbi:DUF2203 domain-containing protein [Microaerobacter geothermalis]|uniref:DUF2203 domain-containing protein n=1 Tax=Microaerobacter geothermalis TaxID=674972 RepID=UPI001F38E7A8|nr:DUF2203 domain-containing protein [Microaerobacter geothermalis]MCF6093548.1 DUF2203 domain-containing protein [Microaerobacter geothermalis]
MSDRIFTLEEANRLLPELMELIIQLRELRRNITRLHDQLCSLEIQDKNLGENVVHFEYRRLKSLYEESFHQFHQRMSRIKNMGCIIQDIELGLVDFPYLHQGELVFLCWKWGEEEIKYWHTLEDGFMGRRPLLR